MSRTRIKKKAKDKTRNRASQSVHAADFNQSPSGLNDLNELQKKHGNKNFQRLVTQLKTAPMMNKTRGGNHMLSQIIQRQEKKQGEKKAASIYVGEDESTKKKSREVNAQGEQIQAEGDGLYKQGKYKEAYFKYYTLWMYHDKENVVNTSSYNMGLCSLKMGDFKEAIKLFGYYLEWKGANKQLGSYQIARARKALKKEEENKVEHQWGSPEQAKKSQEVVAKGPEIQAQADALYKEGKYKEAYFKYQTLWMYHDKENVVSTSSYNMGLCNFKMGDYKTAIRFFGYYLDWKEANKQLGLYQIRRARKALREQK